MTAKPTPEQTIHELRAKFEISDGWYIIGRRICDGLATIIEQNERIIAELQPAEKSK